MFTGSVVEGIPIINVIRFQEEELSNIASGKLYGRGISLTLLQHNAGVVHRLGIPDITIVIRICQSHGASVHIFTAVFGTLLFKGFFKHILNGYINAVAFANVIKFSPAGI